MNIGGCINAQGKKSSYETYGTRENQRMIVNTLSNLYGEGSSDNSYDSIRSDADTYQLWAVICTIGALVAGGTFVYTNTNKS